MLLSHALRATPRHPWARAPGTPFHCSSPHKLPNMFHMQESGAKVIVADETLAGAVADAIRLGSPSPDEELNPTFFYFVLYHTYLVL